MSEQGEQHGPDSGERDDWWAQLYDAEASDTGRSRARDTLDDRFASVTRTVGLRTTTPTTSTTSTGAPGDGAQGDGAAGSGDGPRDPGGPEESEAPEAREVPEEPSVPDAPEVPDPPEIPDPPRTPESPGLPDMPDVPEVPEAPDVPEPPSLPTPSVPVPSVPGPAPEPDPLPGELPDEPDLPAPPDMPDVPDLPEAPDLPGPPPVTGEAPAGHGGFGPPPDMSTDADADADSDTDSDPEPVGVTASAAVGPAPGVPREDGVVAPAALPVADPAALAELVPDTALDGAHYGTLTLRAVSTRGAAGREAGLLRGDALLTARFGSGGSTLLLVAVASGGHRAAREVCQSIGGAVGRSHARLAEDINGGRRGALKSGLNRLTDRAYGKLRAQAAALGLDPGQHTAELRCLLLPADPRCLTRVFFGIGTGGLFRLRDGAWQDIEPRVADETGTGTETAGEGGNSGSAGRAGPSEEAEDDLSQGSRPTMKLGTTRLDDPAARAAARDGFQEESPEEPRAEPFRFRASEARQGDVLLLCSKGLAGPVRDEPAFAASLKERWSEGAPGLAGFLSDVQHRTAEGYGGDRTAVAVWES